MNSNTLSIAVIISFLVISFTMSNDLTAQTNSIRDAEWNHSGTLLAVAYEDHVSIYDSQMNLVTELSSGTRRIIWNNDDTRIAAISTRVRIFDTTNFNEISQFTRDAISDAGEWHPTNSEILALATNEYIQIWNTSNGTLLSEFSGGNYSVDDIEWYSNGTNLIAGSVYPQLAIWDTSQGTITQQFLESYFYAEIIALSPDETLVAFKSDTANLDIWDLTNNSLESTLYTSLNNERILEIIWNTNGLAVLFSSGHLQVWNAEASTVISEQQTEAVGMTWRPGTTEIAIWGRDSSLPEIINPISIPTCDFSPTDATQLIADINTANGTPEPDTICLAESGTYTFTAAYTSSTALLQITSALTTF